MTAAGSSPASSIRAVLRASWGEMPIPRSRAPIWLSEMWRPVRPPGNSHGLSPDVVDPRVVSKEEAAPLITGSLRKVFPRLPFEQAVLLRRG